MNLPLHLRVNLVKKTFGIKIVVTQGEALKNVVQRQRQDKAQICVDTKGLCLIINYVNGCSPQITMPFYRLKLVTFVLLHL